MTEHLQEEKIKGYKDLFYLIDNDKSGYIDIQELADIMKALGLTPNQAELIGIIEEVDKDHSGKIELKEFLDLFSRKIKNPDTEEDLIETFKKFDTDGNGLITAKELRHVMATLGENMTEEEADEMIREADKDEDGYINYQEFVKIMMTK